MALGFAAATGNAILNALCRNTAWSQPAAVWVQLHVGDPGAAGTSSVAVETDRMQATFGSVASGGAISNTVALSWTLVAGTEDYTHWSAWTLVTAGTFLFSGAMTANAVVTNDTFTIPIGDIDLTLSTAA